MYITIGTSKHYTVTGHLITDDQVRYTLEEAPAELGASIKLWTADGTLCLRTDTVADWAHPRISGDMIILSNTPEPVPVEPTLGDTTPTIEDDLLETVVDHEVRIANVELGVAD